MTDPVIALVAAIFGGAGLKLLENIFSRSQAKSDLATQLREELRRDVAALREEIDDIDESLDSWKQKYYNLLGGFNELAMHASNNGLGETVGKIKKSLGHHTF
jgi:hypothetical protein